MLLNIFLVSCISLFINPLYASPWLQDSQEIHVGCTGFLSNLHFSLYKCAGSYGLSDNLNLGVDSNYIIDKNAFDNDVWLKLKVLEKDQNDLRYVLSVQASSSNFIYDAGFHFNNVILKGLLGVKLDTLFAAFEVANAFTLQDYSPAFSLSLGYDYSEYTTVLFAKELFSSNKSWKFGFIKNILATIDIICNYHYYVSDSSKLEVGARFRFRP